MSEGQQAPTNAEKEAQFNLLASQRSIAQQEVLADEIASNQATIVDFDRRRNHNREALRALEKQHGIRGPQAGNASPGQGALGWDTVPAGPYGPKTWVYSGDVFLKLDTRDVVDTLTKEQETLDHGV
eukprot:TRINITY_DN4107_c0_g1_i7.p2 TRINITY_DN4107_c0_g1~~TRINITY_DN4107_c0_g1_i7.p2  ORF type:complete len:127 (+),score=12.19 TRINITY_DN4107_c0_g1_i7:69-449(+)